MPIPEFQGEVVLVTGAAGFIGSHLVDSLLERGAHVRALDNLSTGNIRNIAAASRNPKFRFVNDDVRSEHTIHLLPVYPFPSYEDVRLKNP